jgi:hypothetical protein
MAINQPPTEFQAKLARRAAQDVGSIFTKPEDPKLYSGHLIE